MAVPSVMSVSASAISITVKLLQSAIGVAACLNDWWAVQEIEARRRGFLQANSNCHGIGKFASIKSLRIDFEFSPKSRKNYPDTNYPWLNFLSFLQDFPVGLCECLQLMQSTHCGEKIPSTLNVLGIDSGKFDVLLIKPIHLKLILLKLTAEIKSYVSITESINTLPANELKFFWFLAVSTAPCFNAVWLQFS